MTSDRPVEFFNRIATRFLARETVPEGTLMGVPCLRSGGEFFAMVEHRTGDLIAKLPARRVKELIEAGLGAPFAPAGRTFREWVFIADRDSDLWERIMKEAIEFVSS
jgi:hypothetical protein